MCKRKSKKYLFEYNHSIRLFFLKLDRLTKSIDTVQKDINSRYPYADISPGNS